MQVLCPLGQITDPPVSIFVDEFNQITTVGAVDADVPIGVNEGRDVRIHATGERLLEREVTEVRTVGRR